MTGRESAALFTLVINGEQYILACAGCSEEFEIGFFTRLYQSVTQAALDHACTRQQDEP